LNAPPGQAEAGACCAWWRELTGRLFSVAVLLVRQPPFRRGGAGRILSQMLAFPYGAKTMTLTIEAVYENGVLKPVQPLPLQEHEKVRITVEQGDSPLLRAYGIIGWTGDAQTLERIALDPEFLPEESP
jgi:predicted DNA-binding antitoxin AbrB/MazE fold protein